MSVNVRQSMILLPWHPETFTAGTNCWRDMIDTFKGLPTEIPGTLWSRDLEGPWHLDRPLAELVSNVPDQM